LKKIIFCCAALFLLVSCGDKEGYKTPMVAAGDIYQTACRADGGEEKISYKIDGKTIVVKHENIYMPEGTIAGIEDNQGVFSYESGAAYFLLDGDEENINLKEKFKKAGNAYCYFDLTMTVTNISGGEYGFSVWGDDGREIAFWEDVRIR